MCARFKLPLFFLGFVLIFSGCGKKETVSSIDKTSKAGTDKLALAGKGSGIPVLNEELEDFFDNDDENISEFAFVDDESFNELNQDKKNSNVVVASSDDINFAKDNFFEDDEEEDSFVSWAQDEEQDAQEQVFQTVYFDINKNDVKKDQKDVLKADIEKAKDAVKDGKKIVVQGHCCQLGSASFNIPLSERRAQVIKKEMVKNGIPEDSIKILGKGQEEPVVWPTRADKREQIEELSPNRRAEISIVS